MAGETTRRAILAGSAALPAAVASIGPAAALGPMMMLLAERNALADWINAEPDWGPEREAERDAIHVRIFTAEDRILGAPADTRDALEAKVDLFLKLDAEGAEVVHEYSARIMRGVQAMIRGQL